MNRLDSNELKGAVLAHPLFLLIVDSDTRRFSLEGPVPDATAWEVEAKRIRRNRRDVQCLHADEDCVLTTIERLRCNHFDEWPPKSIVDPPNELSLTCTCSTESRNRLEGRIPYPQANSQMIDKHRHDVAEQRN